MVSVENNEVRLQISMELRVTTCASDREPRFAVHGTCQISESLRRQRSSWKAEGTSIVGHMTGLRHKSSFLCSFAGLSGALLEATIGFLRLWRRR